MLRILRDTSFRWYLKCFKSCSLIPLRRRIQVTGHRARGEFFADSIEIVVVSAVPYAIFRDFLLVAGRNRISMRLPRASAMRRSIASE